MYSVHCVDRDGKDNFDLGCKYQIIEDNGQGRWWYKTLHTGVCSKKVAKQIMEKHGLRVIWMYDGSNRVLVAKRECP